MAYTLYYTANFSNEKNQDVLVNIYKKDGATPIGVPNYEVMSLELTDNGEDDTKYNWLYIRQMELILWAAPGALITWETFISSEYDEWKIECIIDEQKYFEGFIMPDEGDAPFQDQPYEITIRATNGLALLKDVPLTDVNGAAFSGDNTLIKYLAGALKKTGLSLPIRAYCTYLYANHLNKGNGLQYDMFSQTYLDHRTFLKNTTDFVSCWEALKLILDRFCSLEYWNGMWQIVCIQDKQYVPGDWFYVDRDANGDNPVGAKVTDNYGLVGKQEDIYPINETQRIGSRFAVRSVKTTYNYEVFPNLLNNEGLQELGAAISGLSGNILDVDDQDNDGNTSEIIGTYQGYELSGWVHKKKFLAETNPVTRAYIKVEKDLFLREISRYYVVERDATAPVDSATLNYIRNDNKNFYVKAGDRIDISVTGRLNADISNIWSACQALIYTGGDPASDNSYWWLDPFGTFRNGSGGSIQACWAQYSADLDISDWQTVTLDNVSIPVDGVLITKLNCGFPPGSATEAHFKDLKVEYYIFVGGSYFNAKGDYWLRTQTKNFLDKTEDEVYMSDSLRRITKGAMIFKNDTVDYETSPEWYRFYQIGNINPGGVYTHFKDLINNGRYNHSYRRFYAIEGDFDGLQYSSENNPGIKYPIGFHKQYRFIDMAEPRDFVLVAPLKMDVTTGWISATFIEVRKDNNDGTQVADSSTFNYIF